MKEKGKEEVRKGNGEQQNLKPKKSGRTENETKIAERTAANKSSTLATSCHPVFDFKLFRTRCVGYVKFTSTSEWPRNVPCANSDSAAKGRPGSTVEFSGRVGANRYGSS
jgi:hypothetical protein